MILSEFGLHNIKVIINVLIESVKLSTQIRNKTKSKKKFRFEFENSERNLLFSIVLINKILL